jgi:predicted phosphate transport protein (TIGR00153 family)
MFRSIIPREEVFFDNFEKICALMTEAAKHLRTMLEIGGPYDEAARRIKGIENEADELTHRSIETLHKTFVTPLDRQDILRLVVGLDDILDTTEAVSSLLDLYNPRKTMREATRLADLLVQGTEKVAVMVGLLRQLSKQSDRLLALAVELNHLENEADRAYQQAIARLFQEEDDPKELIKWKDILEHIERATDRCEDVADIIEGIVLENA